jgi:diaminohydroxyphosphoribosylaminopyrimidine deaminase/5-amino-6-(5-phosphoribosylamino)uracil reductase
MTNDTHYMQIALRLARRGLGRSWPNPAVGCVIVQDVGGARRILGRGWTQPGGRPHAETVALSQARDRYGAADVAGATAYVSFEPCSHHGETPPCTEALIEARISRVVVACPDPDDRVSGNGIERLQKAGIEVAENILQAEAEDLNAGFIYRALGGLPLVTLKTATSADGFRALIPLSPTIPNSRAACRDWRIARRCALSSTANYVSPWRPTWFAPRGKFPP